MSQPREWSIWKDFGYPGRVVVPGADGEPLEYTFTPADFAQMCRTGNAKIRDAWHVPACWEHQNVEPSKVRLSRGERDERFAKGVFATIAEFATTPRGGGKVRITGTDPKDYEQVLKVKFVSPEIAWDWRDSDGKVWAGPTVTHLAATPRPVQRHQHPFGADPDAPYPGPAARAATLGDAVRMSLAAAGVTPTLHRARTFGRLRLALDHYAEKPPMADDNLFGVDTGAGSDGGATTAGDGDDAGKGGKKKGSPWERIAGALMEHCGIDLGDVSEIKDAAHFAHIVEVAASNYKNGAEPEGDEYDDQPDPDADPNGDAPPEGDLPQIPPGATEPPPPVQMSLQKTTQKAEALQRRVYAAEIADLEKTRRIGPATAEKLKKSLPTLRLSFAANGDVEPNKLSTQLDALKELPASAAWSPKAPAGKPGKKKARLSQRGNVTEVRGSDYAAETPEDDDAVVEAFEANVGRGKK